MLRVDWEDLPEHVHRLVESKTGPITRVETAAEGKNSEVATFLTTPARTVFVKGLRSDHPRVWTQNREAQINPYVLTVGPRLLWHIETAGWNLLGFEYVEGRHADYTPDSPDLPKIIRAMRRLGQTRAPDNLQIKTAEQRWAGYLDDASERAILAGNALLHTDYNPLNVLISNDRARLIDWAWPTRGPAWIDPACLIIRLITDGHTPAQAEHVAGLAPAWQAAPTPAINTFATATCRMWAEIARDDPSPWKQHMMTAAQRWEQHRLN